MRKWIVLVPVFVLGASLWAAPQDAPQPSLGDLARQQKAKEKQAPKKVFDNENLPANDGSVTTGATGATVVAPPSAPSATPAGAAGASTAKPAAVGAAANRKVDPEKVKQAQVKLDRLKNDMDNLEKNYKSLEEKVANSTDDFQRRIYQEGLDTRQSETSALQQRLDAAQKELEDAQKGEVAATPAPAPAPQQQAPEGEQPPAPEAPQAPPQ